MIRTCLIIAALFLPQDPAKTAIECKFRKGEPLKYETYLKSSFNLMGQDMLTELTTNVSHDVRDVVDGVGTFRVAWDRVRMKMTGMMAIDFDSDKKDDPKDDEKFPDPIRGILAELRTMAGKAVVVSLNAKGETVAVKRDDAAPKDQVPPDEAHVRQSMTMAFGYLPKAPVAKGEKWESEVGIQLGFFGKVSFKVVNELKDVRVRDGVREAVIGQVYTLKPLEAKKEEKKDEKKEEKKEQDPPAGLPAPELIDASGKGEVVWLLDAGTLHSSDGNLELDVKIGGMELALDINLGMKKLPVAVPAKEQK